MPYAITGMVLHWLILFHNFLLYRMGAMNAIFADPDHVVDSSGAGNPWHRNADHSVVTVSVFTKLLMLGTCLLLLMQPCVLI